jgi:hypothetical protein
MLLVPLLGTGAASAGVLFYGGDFDYDTGSLSHHNGTAATQLTFDDFSLTSASRVTGLWGNYVYSTPGTDPTPTTIYYEVRSGLSADNGGTLVSSGILPAALTWTGRVQYSKEYQVLGTVDISLAAGSYWLAVAPVDPFADWLVLTTKGDDAGPGSDPNPPPTDGPRANGNSFIKSPTANYVPSEVFHGPGHPGGRTDFDFSYGVQVIPEPSQAVQTVAIVLTSGWTLGWRRWRANS